MADWLYVRSVNVYITYLKDIDVSSRLKQDADTFSNQEILESFFEGLESFLQLYEDQEEL